MHSSSIWVKYDFITTSWWYNKREFIIITILLLLRYEPRSSSRSWSPGHNIKYYNIKMSCYVMMLILTQFFINLGKFEVLTLIISEFSVFKTENSVDWRLKMHNNNDVWVIIMDWLKIFFIIVIMEYFLPLPKGKLDNIQHAYKNKIRIIGTCLLLTSLKNLLLVRQPFFFHLLRSVAAFLHSSYYYHIIIVL